MDGHSHRLGAQRAIVMDVLRCASKVPSFPVERSVDLSQVAQARQQANQRISWTALFTRAYGLVSREHPQLRHVYVAWPWPRVYQCKDCVISIAVNRQLAAGERLFFGRLEYPDTKTLPRIQADLHRFQSDDPARVFRSQWRGAKLPTAIRRLSWWWRMQIDYWHRAKRVGTGSISTLAGQGVTNRLHPCMMTTSFSFGPLDEHGRSLVTLQCDHRLIDGAAAARALNALCDTLCTRVLHELRELSASATGDAAEHISESRSRNAA